MPAELADLVAATKATPRCRSRSASGSAPRSRRPQVGEIADGVIIGSRLVRAAGEAGSAADAPSRRLVGEPSCARRRDALAPEAPPLGT